MQEYLDPDERCGSPGLEASTVNYGVKKPTPPPFLRSEERSPESGDAKPPADEGPFRKRQQKFSKPETVEGDSVLIRHLEPNRPDIAIAEFSRGNPFKEEVDDFRPPPPKKLKEPKLPEPKRYELPQYDRDNVLKEERSDHQPDTGPLKKYEEPEPPRTSAEPSNPVPDQGTIAIAQNALGALLQKPLDVPKPRDISPEANHRLFDPPRLPPPSSLEEGKPLNPSLHNGHDTLPAIHPHAAASPSDTPHSLPSIQTALGGMGGISTPKESSTHINKTSPYSLPPVTASSPPVPRAGMWDYRPAQFQQIPSPYSHFSPASIKNFSAASSPASQAGYWRAPPKSDIHFVTSPNDVPHSTGKSPGCPATSYPTPTDQTPPSGERTPFNPLSHPSGTVGPGTFKCDHPGCTAAPFQTQYLLNSHANVHSQDRPHFCPVEGCPRGVGGRGFKRKNEMIRHGLVHNSPGYVCPFCPDQQHKYPRPDNLQRHVRVHHVDKNRDDPALRHVLAQRPEGSARGRRRQRNSAH